MSEILTSESEKFLNQLPEGPYDEIVDCGIMSKTEIREKGTIVNGKRNGPFSRYKEDGSLLEKGNYKDGEQHGTITSFWKDGSISRIENYTNGYESGEFISYYVSGKVRQKGTWGSTDHLKGTKVGHWCELYTEDGILLSRTEEGEETFRHENEEELDTGAPYEI